MQVLGLKLFSSKHLYAQQCIVFINRTSTFASLSLGFECFHPILWCFSKKENKDVLP